MQTTTVPQALSFDERASSANDRLKRKCVPWLSISKDKGHGREEADSTSAAVARKHGEDSLLQLRSTRCPPLQAHLILSHLPACLPAGGPLGLGRWYHRSLRLNQNQISPMPDPDEPVRPVIRVKIAGKRKATVADTRQA